MAFYISGPKLLFETTEISTHPNSTQQESNCIYLYTTKFGTSIKIRLNRKFESTEFETMRVNCMSYITEIQGGVVVWSYGGVIYNYICHILLKYKGPSWSWSYGGVIYNYICHILLEYKGPSWSWSYGGMIYNNIFHVLLKYKRRLYLYLYPMKFCQLRHTSLIGVIKHNVTISQLSIQSSTKVFTRHMLFT